jgi:hypothetical protein
MLLEMITGKSPLEQSFGGDMNLTKWVRDSFPGHAQNVIDKRLMRATTDAISEGVQESDTEKLLLDCLLVPMIEVALSCAAQSPDDRSSMHDSNHKVEANEGELLAQSQCHVQNQERLIFFFRGRG